MYPRMGDWKRSTGSIKMERLTDTDQGCVELLNIHYILIAISCSLFDVLYIAQIIHG